MRDGTVVVVGAGQAGAWAARTLRSEGFRGRIVLVGDEAWPPYERPPLSKEQLERIPAPPQYLISLEEFSTLNIELRRSSFCDFIDRVGSRVRLAEGDWIEYDKLILCTGGRSRLPTIPGIDAPCVHTLRTIEDSANLREAIHRGGRVLIVGGGWIGLEVAAAARAAGCHVTLVEATRRLCSRTGSAQLSEFLARLHRANGVDVRLGTGVTALEDGTQDGCRAVFSDGTVMEADVVVVGVGLVPNDRLARDAGLACDGGILVDQQCRTSDALIFAAGDVTAIRRPEQAPLRLESWHNAQDQAIAAARAVLGQEINYRPLPYFWSQQYGSLVHIAGTTRLGTEAVVRVVDDSRFVAVEIRADGQIESAVSVNLPREFRQLRKLVAEGTRVDVGRLRDANVPLVKAVA